MTTEHKVWVVDDEKSIRWVLDKALVKAGMQVSCFDSAEAVLEQINFERPEVIISDIRMHGMDGLELLNRLKSSHPDLPIIIMKGRQVLNIYIR